MSDSTLVDAGISSADAEMAGDVVADFLAAVGSCPDADAVVHNGVSITYRDLAERVIGTGLGYRTELLELQRETVLIGALVAHTPAVVDHVLGILYAGGAYCPIDAALPAARKRALAAALGVDRLFAADGNAEVPATGGFDELNPMWRGGDPAYVVCTSGSTGTPKPVVISRHALTVTTRALRELFAVTREDRVLQFASLGWDTCFEEIMPTLTAGATLIFDDAAHSGSFPSFVRMLAQRKVTVLDLPTAFWHELVLYLHEEKATLPRGVRLVVIGGERVDPTRLDQWRALDTDHIRLLNTFGCTETTMITHAVQLNGPGTEAGILAHGAEPPLGRALPHVADYVSASGELQVSGPSLATEYLGLPEATASAFPTVDRGSGAKRWFGTGDVVVRGGDGLLYSRGRADEQVKVLGVRVHPVEVELHLNSHPAVGGAVVVGERRLGRTVLAAYVVAADPITGYELKRYLHQRLPSQFVPSRVTFIDALSYTASGKVDRLATQRAATEHDSRGAGR